MLFNVCSQLSSFPLPADWRKSDSSVDGEKWRWNSNFRDVVASTFSFSRSATSRAAWRACLQAKRTVDHSTYVTLIICSPLINRMDMKISFISQHHYQYRRTVCFPLSQLQISLPTRVRGYFRRIGLKYSFISLTGNLISNSSLANFLTPE